MIPVGIDTPSTTLAEVDRPEDVALGVPLETRLVEVTDGEMTGDVADCTVAVVCGTVMFGTIGENNSSAPASSCRQ